MGTMPCGAPPGFRDGEARHSRQEGRRDARRWPIPPEEADHKMPPQGGEPERRRDVRRTRRKAGAPEKRPRDSGSVRNSVSKQRGSRHDHGFRTRPSALGLGHGHGPGPLGELRRALRENGPRGVVAGRGSPRRAWRSQSSLKKKRHADDRSVNGETTGTAPVGPEARLSPLRPLSCSAEYENHVPQ
jgi:hypothetical protein